VLRSSFAVQKSSRHTASSPEPIINDNPSALSGTYFFLTIKSTLYVCFTLLSKRKFRDSSRVKYLDNTKIARIHIVWTSSMEGKARWPGVVLGKIKSLWSSSQGTANDGLNQLINSTNRIAGRKSF